jgi:PAS domain S-box-containing protein
VTVGVCGIATDITERKQLELENERLAAIVDSSNDAIVSEDLGGIIRSWNQGAERLFGYTAAEAIGQPVSMLSQTGVQAAPAASSGDGAQGLEISSFEAQWIRKNSSPLEVQLTVSAIRDSAGRITGVSKIARDISDRKRSEEERAALHAREQHARTTAERLNQIGPMLLAELDLKKLVQVVTDTATQLVGADFGAFFYNVFNEAGESYMLYTLSGVDRAAFDKFPMPRSTALFGPTFRGEGVVRCHDVTSDDRYGPCLSCCDRVKWRAACFSGIKNRGCSTSPTKRSERELRRRRRSRLTMHACSSTRSGRNRS